MEPMAIAVFVGNRGDRIAPTRVHPACSIPTSTPSPSTTWITHCSKSQYHQIYKKLSDS